MVGIGSTIEFKPDSRLRNKFFVPDSFSHPAKMHIGLFQEILARYEIQPGSWLLDPMAGSGTVLLACQQGINVVANEMESHFVLPMLEAWHKIQAYGPQLGYSMGQAVIVRGDARMLPLQSADAIVTSPPYEGSLTLDKNGIDESKLRDPYGPNSQFARPQTYTRPVSAVVTSPPYEGSELSLPDGGTRQGEATNSNRNRAYTWPVDAVITSLPYEGIVGDHKEGPGAGANEERYGRWGKGTAKQNSYTQVDAVVTSPPYEGQITDPHDRKCSIDETKWGDGRKIAPPHSQVHLDHNYGGGDNIGNFRGPRYWEAMSAVYRECHRVLIPGGIMALVVKGYTRDKKYVDLPCQTADLIESLGFQVFDRWTRKVPLSFWRTLQKQNGNWDENLRFEHVIVGRKP